MATRTVKFIGHTSDNVNVSMQFNGESVFTGAISPAGSPDSPAELFSFDIDRTLAGNIPSSITVSGGSLTAISLSANYSIKENEAFTNFDGVAFPAVTASDVTNTYNWLNNGANTSKINIVIGGEDYDKGDTTDPSNGGAWHIRVEDGQTMTCDYSLDASPV